MLYSKKVLMERGKGGMTSNLNEEQRILCVLLNAALNGGTLSEEDRQAFAAADQKTIVHTAKQHSVLPLLYDVLCGDGMLGEELRGQVEAVSRQTVRQSYRLLFLTRYLTQIFEREHLPVVVLKGCGVAVCYPVPELRKSGDVDLLVREQDIARAQALLEREGYQTLKEQHANHHIVCSSGEGICVELHVMLAEPFAYAPVNTCMKELTDTFADHIVRRPCMDIEFPLLQDARQAYQLLLHMLQHFLRAGFGLKLLCDWAVFWNGQGKGDTWQEFEQLAKKSEVYEFAKIVTECCVEFLGLCREFLEPGRDRELAEKFLCDVFDAEEFGRSSAERMVAVQGKGMKAYWKEFHHQMKMNHPKASKCVVFWPVLWIVTFFVFVRNNRRLKRGSIGSIMRNAGARGRLVRQMKLWEKSGGNQDRREMQGSCRK